jgi:hypothetical protein
MCNLANPFDLEEGMGEKTVSVEECFDCAKEILKRLPEGEVKGLVKGYQAKWLVLEIVVEALGGRVIWDWQRY